MFGLVLSFWISDISTVENIIQCVAEIGFDNTEYIRIFRDRLEENGYDYLIGFILNVGRICRVRPDEGKRPSG